MFDATSMVDINININLHSLFSGIKCFTQWKPYGVELQIKSSQNRIGHILQVHGQTC